MTSSANTTVLRQVLRYSIRSTYDKTLRVPLQQIVIEWRRGCWKRDCCCLHTTRRLLRLTWTALEDARGFVGVDAEHAGRLDGSPAALAGTQAGCSSGNIAPFPSALVAAYWAADDAIPTDSFGAVSAKLGHFRTGTAGKYQTRLFCERVYW